MDMFDSFGGSVSDEYKHEYGEVILAYEECYRRLYDKYKKDILELESILKDIRKEREEFFLIKYPKVQEILKDDIISEEAKREWLSEFKRNMENSFKTSELIISHYITKTSEELKKELKEKLEKV